MVRVSFVENTLWWSRAIEGIELFPRLYNIPRENSVCKECLKKNEIGGEFHYLLICNDPIILQSRKSLYYSSVLL